jgi:hypothetical protein
MGGAGALSVRRSAETLQTQGFTGGAPKGVPPFFFALIRVERAA